jgi:SAM-dependent methyltransferase
MFYQGLSAFYYDAFFCEPDEAELQFYQQIIASADAPTLEIACGTGRLLLPLLQTGFSVEGFDSSPEMLELCKQKASKVHIEPIIYHEQMQTLALPKQYGCMFSAIGSFQQLSNLDDAYEALKRFHQHLLPQGKLVIYLYLPWYNAPEFGQWHEHEPVILQDGQSLLVAEKTVHDPIEQQMFMVYRYQLKDQDKVIATEEKEMTIRWYSRHEFELMLSSVGFENIEVYNGYNNTGPADVMIFVASR